MKLFYFIPIIALITGISLLPTRDALACGCGHYPWGGKFGHRYGGYYDPYGGRLGDFGRFHDPFLFNHNYNRFNRFHDGRFGRFGRFDNRFDRFFNQQDRSSDFFFDDRLNKFDHTFFDPGDDFQGFKGFTPRHFEGFQDDRLNRFDDTFFDPGDDFQGFKDFERSFGKFPGAS